MMANFNSNEFKKLQRLWYEKLATTPDHKGNLFVDIEDTTRDYQPLKSWHDKRFKAIPIEKRLSQEEYYDEAKKLLLFYEFKNYTHRRIWELHCDGYSRREIAILITHLTPCYGQARIGEIVIIIAKSIGEEPNESDTA